MAPSVAIASHFNERIRKVKQNFFAKKNDKIPQQLGELLGGIRKLPDFETTEVTISLSNLHPSILASELRLHFAEFQLKTILLDLCPQGLPLGTGSFHLPKYQALRLIQRYTGMCILGREVHFKLMDQSTFSRLTASVEENEVIRSHSAPSTPSTSTNMCPRSEYRKEHSGQLRRRFGAAKMANQDMLSSTFCNLSI